MFYRINGFKALTRLQVTGLNGMASRVVPGVGSSQPLPGGCSEVHKGQWLPPCLLAVDVPEPDDPGESL